MDLFSAREEARGRDLHLDRHRVNLLLVLDGHPGTADWAGAHTDHIDTSQVHNRGVGAEHRVFLRRSEHFADGSRGCSDGPDRRQLRAGGHG